MASYKFWQTQPVPQFDDQEEVEEGPIKVINREQVPKQPDPLIHGFEWVTIDLEKENELQELYDLLLNHYVEDPKESLRFQYSTAFLNWALKPPGWKKEWHVGVRVSKSGKLVASICGVPAEIRVRRQILKVSEINFLCIHKKLRSRRLAPVLIKEITRRCYLEGIYQAIYTSGTVLPKPVSFCRYYHRALDWQKLYDVKFTFLRPGSTEAMMIEENLLPSGTATPHLRPMQAADVDPAHDLLGRYLERFDLARAVTRDEVEHWLLHKDKSGVDQVVWSYVVEEPETHKITDFVSFYHIENSVLADAKHSSLRVAYLYYYASEMAFKEKEQGLGERLSLLVNDALILAKMAHFDVFNALTSYHNPLFLHQLKFGPGSGHLYFYLFNYRTARIAGGADEADLSIELKKSGVGISLL